MARVEIRSGAFLASSDVTADGHFFIDGVSPERRASTRSTTNPKRDATS